MNTILTDDERPKLPPTNTVRFNLFTAQDMEAYADAREAAVLAKLAAQDPKQPYLDGLIDRLLMPLPSMLASEVEKLMAEAAQMLHLLSDKRKASATPQPAVVQVPQKYDDVLLPFLSLMRRELHANSGKGDRPGWLSMDANTALLEVYYHLSKLQKAVRNNDGPGIQEYAADVANMAMMVLDVCGGIAATPEAPATAVVQVPQGWPEPPSNFQEGQWWVRELDAFAQSQNATDDQKRAVAVVHHLLAAVAAAPEATAQEKSNG